MRARGQGLVEASVALLAAVAVLVAGIHLAEVSELSIRAPMLAHAVLFDANAHSPRLAGPGATIDNLNTVFPRRAADLDLRTSSTGTTWRALFSSAVPPARVADATRSRIERPPDCAYPIDDPAARIPLALDSGLMLRTNLALSASSVGVPRRFLDDAHGFFTAPLSARERYPLCALGRPTEGGCTGVFQLVLDDWAMQDEGPSAPWDRLDCALGECANAQLKARAQGHFGSGTGAASAMARSTLGRSPVDEDGFWLSFRDGASGFEENGFKTGPGPASRTNCYLGVACP